MSSSTAVLAILLPVLASCLEVERGVKAKSVATDDPDPA